MIRAVNSTDSVGISAGAISTEKNQTCILYWTFLFHHLLYVFFVSYWVLKLQVLIFGINVFLCVLFFFFKFWMFLLDYFFFLLFVHIYITSIKLSKFKMPKVHHSHQNKGEKKLPTGSPIIFYGVFIRFFQVFGLFVCCDEFKSSVKMS